MKTLKQVIGIDVSMDTFYACLGIINEQHCMKILSQTSFPNNRKGMMALLKWMNKYALADMATHFVMEATGVYYENLAYFLAENNLSVTVLLPNKSKHFSKSLDLKTKTDKVDAAMLCRIGLERMLPQWKVPSSALKALKNLCRERRTLKTSATQIKTRIHALKHSYQPEKTTIQRFNQQLKFIDKLISAVEKQIKEIIKSDPPLKNQFDNITKVKGLGIMTVATIVAETNGFAQVENAKQLTSYAGLDVVMNQSGKHYGKTRISKRGNSHIRSALYCPAVSAIRFNLHLKQFYQRIMQKRTNGNIGIVAVARKMLTLIYTLWKNQLPYDPMMNVA